MAETNITIVGFSNLNKQLQLLLNYYELPMDPNEIFSAIHVVSVNNSGFDGQLKYDNEEWLTQISSTENGELFASSMEGNVHIFDGAKWTVASTTAEHGLNAIFAASSSTAYAVGQKGEIIKIFEGKTELSYLPTGIRLNRIHGCSETCMYAVGDNGQILKFNGQEWLLVPTMANVNLLCVFCLSENEVYIGGAEGICFHWDGNEWQTIQTNAAIISSFAYYQGKIYAAAGMDGVLLLSAQKLEPFKKLTIYNLYVLENILFAAGSSLFCWFDGVNWRGGEYALH